MAPRAARALALAAVAACMGVAVAVPADGEKVVVDTHLGPVRGVVSETTAVFLGVPYAADTGGQNRFRVTQTRASWTEPLDCLAWGPGCLQTHHNPDVPTQQSEDCLNVNVYAPAELSNASLPVMIFFHGGGFMEGSNRGPFGLYGGAVLQRKGVVVVTANYRLHIPGFLVTSDPSARGNYGLHDQREAMRWVQRNAAAFGGDPSQVTIWGESAGAMSVGLHLISPASRGLFHAAIMESNPLGMDYRRADRVEVQGKPFAAALGCGLGDLACLRSKSTQELATAMRAAEPIMDVVVANFPHFLDGFLEWTPVLDTAAAGGGDNAAHPDVPEQVLDAVAAGRWARVPVLIGTNTNEGETFIYAALGKPLQPLLYDAAVLAVFGLQGPAVLDKYREGVTAPLDLSGDARPALSSIMTDYMMKCASSRLAADVNAQGVPAYVYHFDHVPSFGPAVAKWGLPSICATKVCHASELPFVFGNTAMNITFTEDESRMVEQVQTYWTNFAKSHSPNAAPPAAAGAAAGAAKQQLPAPHTPWPRFRDGARWEVRINAPTVELEQHYKNDLCLFWDKAGYHY